MKVNLRIISLILVLVLSASVLISCAGDSPVDTSASDTTQALGDNGNETTRTKEPTNDPKDDGIETPKTLTIKVEEGKLNYRLVRPQASESISIEVKKAAYMVSLFSDLMGVAPEFDTDWPKKNNPDTLEILVGYTDYDETAAVLDEIKYGEYIVKPVGNKIVIMGYTQNAIEQATAVFANKCRSLLDKSTNTITIDTESFYLKGSTDAMLNELPVFDTKTKAMYYDAGLREYGEPCHQMVMTETDADGYGRYRNVLESSGFVCYTSTEMGQNKFSTYTKDKYTVTLGYFESEKIIRATIEQNAPAAGLESENKSEKKTTSQISLLGQAVTETENGLSVLIRLEDGRFVVIDGGHKGANYASAFISEIKAQASKYTAEPVIAAWIITHNHSDHDALFYQHANEMKKQGITVERVFMNSLSLSQKDRLGELGADDAATGGGSYTKVFEAAKTIGATMYKVHTGQVFHYSNLKIEALYTQETTYPESIVHAINTTSLIMKMTFTDSDTGEKTVFLSTGDATSNAFACLYKNFNDYIAADILCMAHHGGTTGSKEPYGITSNWTMLSYQAVNPKLALWPIGSERVYPVYNSQKDVDDALFACSNIKECYVAGSLGEVTIVPLPYVVGTVNGPHKWNIKAGALEK